MTDLQPVTPTHVLDRDDVCHWLTEHGIDPDRAVLATIVVAGRGPDRLAAHLEVEHYLPGPDGERAAIDPRDPNRAQTATTVVPLHAWPSLRPAPTAPADPARTTRPIRDNPQA